MCAGVDRVDRAGGLLYPLDGPCLLGTFGAGWAELQEASNLPGFPAQAELVQNHNTTISTTNGANSYFITGISRQVYKEKSGSRSCMSLVVGPEPQLNISRLV